MRNKLRFLKKNKQSFLALFVLLVMVFNSCQHPLMAPVGEPEKNNTGDFTPRYFYVDSSGNFTGTDSGRTVLFADDQAYVTFYSDDIEHDANRVGYAFEDKIIIFFFEENRNFPSSMVLSDSNGLYNGYFTPYDSVTQTYSLVIKQDGEQDILSNISLNKDIFTQYKDGPDLTPSQNLRLRNLFVSMCIYKSLDDYIASNDTNARGIFSWISNIAKKFIPSYVVDIVVGCVQTAVGVYSVAMGIYTLNFAQVINGTVNLFGGTTSIINGINQITVVSYAPDGSTATVPVTGVSLNKTSVSLVFGNSETLFPTITPVNATNRNISWSSNNTSVATVSSNGMVFGLGIGSATITATTSDGGKTASCTVIVTPAPVTGVSLNKTSVSLLVGAAETLNQTITPSNATNKSVSWNSSNTAVATISNSGMVTGVSVGTATITVITSDGNKTASCTVTVNPVPVSGVSVKSSTSLVEGGAETLYAEILPSNATNKNVTWSSSNSSVALVSTNGTVTAVSAGSATVTVKTADGNKTAVCNVTVVSSAIAVTGISMNKSSASLDVGSSVILTAVITPSNATNQNITWSSSNTSVATVAADGTVTAVSAGSAIITLKTADGNKTATCNVTVKATSWNVNDEYTWNEAVNNIKSYGNNRTYTINVTGSFSKTGTTANTFGSVTGITVTITGEKEISLVTGSTGSLLRISSNQNVIIKDIDLKGHETNNTSLVYISGVNSSFTMQGNATVSGNNNSISFGGGGVYVGSSGAFNMQNNATVSGNTGRDAGGGVFVASGGIFNMIEGTISGNRNTYDFASLGGGVSVIGTFVMSGGTISGNTAGSGGGVCVFGSGSFTMKGGTISGNTAPISGGGVDVDTGGTFTIQGGTVYGNVGIPLGNICNGGLSGAALYVSGDGSTAKYGNGSNILPHTDGNAKYTNNTITGR